MAAGLEPVCLWRAWVSHSVVFDGSIVAGDPVWLRKVSCRSVCDGLGPGYCNGLKDLTFDQEVCPVDQMLVKGKLIPACMMTETNPGRS